SYTPSLGGMLPEIGTGRKKAPISVKSTSTGVPGGSVTFCPIHPWLSSLDVSRHESVANAPPVPPTAFSAFIDPDRYRAMFFSYPLNVVMLYSSGGVMKAPVPFTVRRVLSYAVIDPCAASQNITSYVSPPLRAGSMYRYTFTSRLDPVLFIR